MTDPIPACARYYGAGAQCFSDTANTLASIAPEGLDFSYSGVEGGFCNPFEQAYHSWYRWYFLTKEVMDLTTKYSIEETVRCINCGFNPCACSFWCYPLLGIYAAR